MIWSSEIPVVPGYYWVRGNGTFEPFIVQLYALLNDERPDVVHFFGTDDTPSLQEWAPGNEFSGPIKAI